MAALSRRERMSGMKKVLVVDDNTDFLEMLGLMLGTTYEVLACESLPQVADRLPRFSPDIVLLDRHLREYTAEDVLKVLARHDLGKVPVLLISGSADVHEEAERLNCTGHLVKPFSNAALKRSLEEALAGANA